MCLRFYFLFLILIAAVYFEATQCYMVCMYRDTNCVLVDICQDVDIPEEGRCLDFVGTSAYLRLGLDSVGVSLFSGPRCSSFHSTHLEVRSDLCRFIYGQDLVFKNFSLKIANNIPLTTSGTVYETGGDLDAKISSYSTSSVFPTESRSGYETNEGLYTNISFHPTSSETPTRTPTPTESENLDTEISHCSTTSAYPTRPYSAHEIDDRLSEIVLFISRIRYYPTVFDYVYEVIKKLATKTSIFPIESEDLDTRIYLHPTALAYPTESYSAYETSGGLATRAFPYSTTSIFPTESHSAYEANKGLYAKTFRPTTSASSEFYSAYEASESSDAEKPSTQLDS